MSGLATLDVGLDGLMAARGVLEREVLPGYLPQRRWFASKGEPIAATRISYAAPLPGTPILFTEVAVDLPGRTESYVLPLGVAPDGVAPGPLALASVPGGTLTDAFALDGLTGAMLDGMRAGSIVAIENGTLAFRPTAAMSDFVMSAHPSIRRLSAEQSNSSWIVDDTLVLKLVRRVLAGVHPEGEMTRLLTERGYRNTPPLFGEVVRVSEDGTPHTVALAQGFVPNQGDGWGWTLERLGAGEAAEGYDGFARSLGKRLGELHVVLSEPGGDAAFRPEPATAEVLARWAEGAIEQIDKALDLLAGVKTWSDDATRDKAALLVGNRAGLHRAAHALAAAGEGAVQTRVHGDFHLGQVLVSDEDAFIIDFEGEPARTMAQRRAKSCPLRDVAGLLRSFDYAAAASGGSVPAGAAFRDRATATALEAYRAVLAGSAHPWVPASAEGPLLDLFLLEKAAYEIVYEVANRPTWIAIPLGGFHAIAARLLGEQA